MEVKFIAVPSDSLNQVPIKNGQVICLTDVSGYYYDMSGVRNRIGSALSDNKLPASGQPGVIYVLTESNDSFGAGFYFWDTEKKSWTPLGVNRIKGVAELSYRSGDVIISPKDIGLDKVENLSVSDIFKKMKDTDVIKALGYTPISVNDKGKPNGVPSLDETGKIPTAQLPPSREFILNVATAADLPETGTVGALYVAEDTNNYYVWNGTNYSGVPSMSSSRNYSAFQITGSSAAFYNNYCIAVRRNISKIAANMPAVVTFKISVTNPLDVSQSSTVIATAMLGTDGTNNQHTAKIVSATVAHGGNPVIKQLCLTNLTTNGWSINAPVMFGFSIESTDLFNVSADILSFTNCAAYMTNKISRQGELSTGAYVSTPIYFNVSRNGFLLEPDLTKPDVEANNGEVVTASRLYRLFGNSSVPKASAVAFEPVGNLTATDVQSAIAEAASQGGSGDQISVIDWEEWKDLTDEQRDAKGIVIVTNTPV